MFGSIQIELTQERLNIERLVDPAGDVLGDLCQFERAVAETRVLEVNDPHAGAVPEIVGEITVAGTEDQRDIRLVDTVHPRVGQPCKAAVHSFAHLTADSWTSLRHPSTNLGDELVLATGPDRDFTQDVRRHGRIELTCRSSQGLQLLSAERLSSKRFTWQARHHHDRLFGHKVRALRQRGQVRCIRSEQRQRTPLPLAPSRLSRRNLLITLPGWSSTA